MVYTQSRFAAWMDRLSEVVPDDPRCAERHEDELRSILADQGEMVEEELLAWVRRAHPDARVVDLTKQASKAGQGGKAQKAKAMAQTLKAMEEADVLYQAPLHHGRFFGIADFLVRRGPLTGEDLSDDSSAPGAGSGASAFAIWDTKLARKERSTMLLQLGLYADTLQVVAGGECERVGLVLGLEAARTGKVKNYEVATLLEEVRGLWEEFLAFQDAFDPRAEPPDPGEVGFSSHGPWERLARRLLWEADDVRILNRITGKQRQKLRDVGLGTCRAVASADLVELRNAGFKRGTAERLHQQARLQRQSVEEGGRLVWVPHPDADEAIAALPAADPGDLFLDLEGDPVAAEGPSLQYLFGLATRDGGFHDWWAHDPEAELAALVNLGRFVRDRRRLHPGLHVYHYGHYERTVLSKIAARLTPDDADDSEAVRELLEGEGCDQGLLVDLLVTMRGTVEMSAGGHGLKQVEKIYRGESREAAVADAASSIVVYKRWRADPDGDTWEESPQLGGIREYNRDDCISLLQLETWLRSDFSAGASGMGTATSTSRLR